MKRLLLGFLCLIMILSLIGCQPSSELPEDSQSTAATEPDSKENETDKEKDYKNIPRVETKEHKGVYLSYGEGLRVFRFMIPDTWTLSSNTGGYRIQRNGREIGSIQTGAGDVAALGKTVFEDEFYFYDCIMQYFVHQSEADGSFRHRYVFNYSERNGTKRLYTILVDLKELDEYSANRLLYAFREEQVSHDSGMGILSLPQNPKILIIGNSFVNSSQVGEIVNSMGGIDCRAVSIGYLTVRRLCSEYADYLADMRDGVYDAVFLCGFYSTEDATKLETVVASCRVSDTQLIVLPAHNENDAAIKAAAKNSYVKLLNWKEEIDFVSNQLDVPMELLRVDDTHGHSRPLAGYIGAHMIYRAIFGRVPPIQEQYGSVTKSEIIDAGLGSYMTDPEIELIFTEQIYYLN